MRVVALVLVSMLLATTVLGDFDKDDIEDTYIRRTGSDDCPGEIEFEDDDFTLEADEVELDNDNCSGGVIRLSKNPDGTEAEKYFRNRRNTVGDFLGGSVDGEMRCGSKTLRDKERILLLETEDDVEIRWEDLFGAESELAKRDGDTVELDDDTKYLILGSRCFYRERLVNICFPGSATVQLRNGVKRMDEVEIGDEVHVGNGEFSKVFAWTHKTRRSANSYVKIETEGGLALTATRSHYVYANDKVVQAGKVKVGDSMTTGEGEKVRVVTVGRVKSQGLYNPQTLNGDIVVDGLLSTTYTSAVEPAAGHALLAPLRAVFSTMGVGACWVDGVTA